MADTVNLTIFEPLVGSQFHFEWPDGAPEVVELTEASALPVQGAGVRQEPFSLIFRARTESRLAQGMVNIRHDTVEPIALFIVPIGKDAEGCYFQAIFN